MASVLFVAPVSLELRGSPPRLYSSPPQVCTEPLHSQQSFARDSHPTGGTITRGFHHCWEEFSPNLITIHKEPVCRHDAPLLPILSCSNVASCHMKLSQMREKKESEELRLETQPVNKKLCELCLITKNDSSLKLYLTAKSPCTHFFFGHLLFKIDDLCRSGTSSR